MNHHARSRIQISFFALSVMLCIGALGWAVSFFVLGNLAAGDLFGAISLFGFEILRAAVIALSAGAFISWCLRQVFSERPGELLHRSGISHIYTERKEARSEFLALVENERTLHIDIVGISLRDFLADGGSLNDVWRAIHKRLQEEERLQAAPDKRLVVRLLLIDPLSATGLFRHRVEAPTVGRRGIPVDVPGNVEVINQAQRTIYQGNEADFLQARLYEQCPFCFMWLTQQTAFVEQYDFRNHTTQVSLPLLKYEEGAPQCAEFRHSFQTIWEHARPARPDATYVGTASAVHEARVKNVFREPDRGILGAREIECIEKTKTDTIDILAISGKHFVNS